MKAAILSGLRWPTICQGNAQCTVCAFIVDDENGARLQEPGEEEAERLRTAVFPGGDKENSTHRLACRARPLCGEITIFKRGVKPLGS